MDISKCTGKGCEMKEMCLRYTSAAGMWQSYFMNPPINDGECDEFWDNEIKTK